MKIMKLFKRKRKSFIEQEFAREGREYPAKSPTESVKGVPGPTIGISADEAAGVFVHLADAIWKEDYDESLWD